MPGAVHAATSRYAAKLGVSCSHLVEILVRAVVPNLPPDGIHHTPEHSRRVAMGKRGQDLGEQKRTPTKVVGPSVIARHYQEAAEHVRKVTGRTLRPDAFTGAADPQYQSDLRRISREFHRRLKEAGIYVEGA